MTRTPATGTDLDAIQVAIDDDYTAALATNDPTELRNIATTMHLRNRALLNGLAAGHAQLAGLRADNARHTPAGGPPGNNRTEMAR